MSTDKQSVIQEVNAEYNNFQETIKGLERDKLDVVFYDHWSVKDIVAHMLGWEREMTEALRRIGRGERATAEGVDYSDADAWNAKFAARMRGQLPTTVLAEWGQVHGGFMKALAAVPDDRFGEGKSVNRIAEGTGYGHYREHVPAIKAWREKEGL
jgi:Protein of unknown function (DUF1706)